MRKIKEVLRLRLEAGLAAREVSKICGIGFGTVIDYGSRAKAAGLSWPLPEGLCDEALETLLFPQRQPKSTDRPVPDWPQVRSELARKGVTLALVWQEYMRENPNGYGYSRFAELFHTWEGARSYTMVQHHRPGEKVFVDFSGLTLPLTDPDTGEVIQAQVFCAATGYAQYLYARVCLTQTLRDWLDCHALAFEFFGGAPEAVVPDNLRSAVSRACRYEPEKNPAYADLARHYGVAVLPARSRSPRDKAKVESGVQIVQNWVLAPLRNRIFFGLEEAQLAVEAELEKLNDRKLSGLPYSRRELFEAEERAFLKALPNQRYVFAEWRKAKVGPDYHVRFDSQAYSVPHRLCGQQTDVRLTSCRVEIYLKGELVAAHDRGVSLRYVSTVTEHMPEAHREYAEWTPQRLARWAAESGPSVRELVETMLLKYVRPEHGFRPAFGIVGLAKRYGHERLERACARALRAGATNYANVKSILEKGLDQLDVPRTPETPAKAHENVRGAGYFKNEDAS
ncbi:MAG: IS21 family transposase [Acidobacteria bacterium]|nr:IS21 family transposase [Acidobacteriota bacterium]